MSTSWKYLDEAEVLRYAHDSKACIRRLDDVLDANVQLREAIDSWKRWYCELTAVLGLEFVEINATLDTVKKLVAEHDRRASERDELRAEIEGQTAEIERLRAIIDRLLKTKDDVRVIPDSHGGFRLRF